MKISKSKQELARIISENGGWRDVAGFSVSSRNGTIVFSKSKPKYTSKYGWTAAGGFIGHRIEVCSYLKNWHQTILSSEEYLHLYPVPDADEWIEWSGGECPVDDCEIVQVKYRDDDGSGMGSVVACELYWEHHGKDCDIISYRQHKPEQAGATEKLSDEAVLAAKSALMGYSIEELVRKPTIEQLAAEYRNAKDYADRKQQEAYAAKADADAKLAELVAAGNALNLVISVAEQEPELVISDWRDLMTDDVISIHCFDDVYSESEVIAVGVDDVLVKHHTGSNRLVDLSKKHWEFIRRP